MTDLEERVERLEDMHGIREVDEPDYSEFEDEDDELDFFAERAGECRCGAWQEGKNGYYLVADCCC